MSVLSSSLFVLAAVYHCSLVVLLHCAASLINKQTNKSKNTFLHRSIFKLPYVIKLHSVTSLMMSLTFINK